MLRVSESGTQRKPSKATHKIIAKSQDGPKRGASAFTVFYGQTFSWLKRTTHSCSARLPDSLGGGYVHEPFVVSVDASGR